MSAIDRSYIVVDRQGTVFDRMLAIVRCEVINLANAINRSRFLGAWLASTELARSLDLAKWHLEQVPEAERPAAGEQLARLQAIAERVQAIAPHPSKTAVMQARSSTRPANRSAWDSEEQAWIAARSAHGPILLAAGPDGLTLGCEGEP